ncbi:MAG TPA: phage tail protein [Baekduia sp.]|nr:phage tail protein [Baekduia sp.]
MAQLTFRVDVQGLTIGRFSQCSGLGVEWEVLEYAEGGLNDFVHGLRGRARYRNVSLSRGLTSEDALLKWFFDVQRASKRPTLTVAVTDHLGKDVRRFGLAAAYPVRWTGPELRTDGPGGGLESLEIGHEGLVA